MGLTRLAALVSKYCIGMEGNISGRFNTHAGKAVDGFVIKCSGVRLNEANKICNYVAVDMTGQQLDNFSCRSSIEKDFHRAIYSKFKEVQFIAHTHPVNTLKILCSDKFKSFAMKRMYPEQVIFNGEYSTSVPYACPGPKLANVIYNTLSSYSECPKLILLKNHGIIACGKSVDECVAITETCEKAAEVFIGAYALGMVNFLMPTEVDELLDNEQEKYRMGQLK